MNIRGALKPEQELHIEARMIENHDFGLPESGLALKRVFVFEEKASDAGVQIHIEVRGALLEQLPGNCRESGWREVACLPTLNCGAS